MLFILFFALFSSAYAEDNYQVVNIYVDITEVHDPQGRVGTSMPLNIMMAEQAQHVSVLEHRLHRIAGAKPWEGTINVFDWKNIRYMPGFSREVRNTKQPLDTPHNCICRSKVLVLYCLPL